MAASVSQPSPSIAPGGPLAHAHPSRLPPTRFDSNTGGPRVLSPSSASSPYPIASPTSSSYCSHHQQTPSAGYVPKNPRPGGIFAFAAAALDRTQNAFTSAAEPSVRRRKSSSRLAWNDAAAGTYH